MKIKISKIPLKFDPRVTWENLILSREHLSIEIWSSRHMGEFDPLSRTSVCLCKIIQWSHFINENTFSKTDKKLSKWKIYSHTVPDRRNLTENAALNAFLKRSNSRSLPVPFAFPFRSVRVPFAFQFKMKCKLRERVPSNTFVSSLVCPLCDFRVSERWAALVLRETTHCKFTSTKKMFTK